MPPSNTPRPPKAAYLANPYGILHVQCDPVFISPNKSNTKFTQHDLRSANQYVFRHLYELLPQEHQYVIRNEKQRNPVHIHAIG